MPGLCIAAGVVARAALVSDGDFFIGKISLGSDGNGGFGGVGRGQGFGSGFLWNGIIFSRLRFHTRCMPGIFFFF